MKESFGATWMIYIFMVFVVIYVIFISLVLNYVRAFKIKNFIINSIEEHDGYNDEVNADIIEYFDSLDFVWSGDGNNLLYKYLNDNPNASNVDCKTDYGYCIEKKTGSKYTEIDEDGVETTTSRDYYKVSTYIYWNFPFLGSDGDWVIEGETKILDNVSKQQK